MTRTIDEIALEYVLNKPVREEHPELDSWIDARSYHFSLLEEMRGRIGIEFTDQAIARATETATMVGLLPAKLKVKWHYGLVIPSKRGVKHDVSIP